MAPASATWTRLAHEERLRRSSHCVSVVGSETYIFGGELVPREPVDNQIDVIAGLDVEATHKTLPAPQTAPTPRVGSATAATFDGVYLFSGRGGTAMAPIEESGAVWRYSPSSAEWSLLTPTDATAPFPEGRSYHAMSSNGKDELYVHAGCPEKGRLSDLWCFNLETRAWTKLPDAPDPARGGSSLTFSHGKLYRMNGFDGKNEQGGSVDVFDIGQKTWSTQTFVADGKHGPEPRSVGALISLQAKGQEFLVTMFGERDPSALGHAGAGKMLGDVWIYDIAQHTWAEVTSSTEAPPPRGWFDADVVSDSTEKSRVVVHGGLAEDNSRLGDVWILDLKWS